MAVDNSSSALRLSDRWIDLRMISLMRLLLAASALIIILIDPSQPNRHVAFTYGALISYVIYSLVLYGLSIRRTQIFPLRLLPWFDLAWYVPLIAASSGTNSIFFFFLFFAIIVASFGFGFADGFRLTVIATVFFTLVGYFFSVAEPDFQLNRFLLRPICLLVLGYLIAYWGGFENRLKQRLRFLKDINTLSNPRFGIERTINWMMDSLRIFYEADSCLLVLRNRADDNFLRRVDAGSPDLKVSNQRITEEVAEILRSPSPTQAVIYKKTRGSCLYDINTGESTQVNESTAMVANTLDTDTFLSAPVYYRGQAAGRLYLTGKRARFSQSDIEFILQVIDQSIPLLDNIRLVDHLASGAAEQEREKIARDIHDTVIQPYVGVQLGLTAIQEKLERGDNDVVDKVKDLSQVIEKDITDLRQYIGGLKGGERQSSILLPALRRFARKFSEATGIKVEVKGDEDLRVNDRLAAEVFQMITEGLSNVRRHTQAHHAFAEVSVEDGNLIVRIENENPGEPVNVSFHPRSLAERATSLGGKLTVDSNHNNSTVVSVQIPL